MILKNCSKSGMMRSNGLKARIEHREFIIEFEVIHEHSMNSYSAYHEKNTLNVIFLNLGEKEWIRLNVQKDIHSTKISFYQLSLNFVSL